MEIEMKGYQHLGKKNRKTNSGPKLQLEDNSQQDVILIPVQAKGKDAAESNGY